MLSQNDKVRSRIYFALVVFLAYAALAVVTTWPLVTQMGTHLPGSSTDALLHYWNGWWVQQALVSNQSPFHTPLLFYPNGVSLVTHNMAYFNILPWLLLEPLVGGVVAYNWVLLLHLTLCGCALFWLTAKLTDDYRAAFLAGLIYQAWPFRLSQLDHPNLLATEAIPIFFFFLIVTIRRDGWRSPLLAGLFFALIGYTRWQLLIPATIMGLVYVVSTGAIWPFSKRRDVLFRLILAGCIAVLALFPPLWLLNQEMSGDHAANLLREGEEAIMQTDLLAYLTPGTHPLLDTQSHYDRYYHDRFADRRYSVYIGVVPLFLLLLALLFKRWKALPWLLMAVVLILLALGPLLRINGHFYENVPMLYNLLSALVRFMRVPDRFNMFLALPISVLAAYGVAGVLARQRWQGTYRAPLLVSLLAALILVEYLMIPVPLQNTSFISSFYFSLAEEAGDFAILNLPFDSLRAKAYMFEQTRHGRPIVQGNTSRLPGDAYAYIDSNPWLGSLRHTHEMSPAFPDIGRQFATLTKDKIRYLLMHKWFIDDTQVNHWQRYLLTEPRYENDRLIAYAIEPEAGRDFKLTQEMTPGLGPIRSLVSTDCLSPNRVLEVDVGWGSTSLLSQDFDVRLSLIDETLVVRQSEQFPLVTKTNWPTSQWAVNSVAWGYYTLIADSLPAGTYTITLELLDSETGERQGEPMSIKPITVQSDICNFISDPEAKELNALYGNQLRLEGYKSQIEARRVDLSLIWRSERRMETDYTIFVHIFEPETGIPVAQSDFRPQQGNYPTHLWWPGETVEEVLTIFLYNVPDGRYNIAIGVYNAATGERLPLLNNQEQPIEDGRLILNETVEVD